jgi:hypothetical protein
MGEMGRIESSAEQTDTHDCRKWLTERLQTILDRLVNDLGIFEERATREKLNKPVV